METLPKSEPLFTEQNHKKIIHNQLKNLSGKRTSLQNSWAGRSQPPHTLWFRVNEGISFDLKDEITCYASLKPLKTRLTWGIEDLITSLGLTALALFHFTFATKEIPFWICGVKHLSKDSNGINQNSNFRLFPHFGEDNPNTKINLFYVSVLMNCSGVVQAHGELWQTSYVVGPSPINLSQLKKTGDSLSVSYWELNSYCVCSLRYLQTAGQFCVTCSLDSIIKPGRFPGGGSDVIIKLSLIQPKLSLHYTQGSIQMLLLWAKQSAMSS